MKPSRPLYFTIHLDRFDQDIDKVSHLMETRYKRDIAVEGKALASHNIELEARLLKQFRTSFRKQIESFVKIGEKDLFQNEYLGFDRYSHIEVSVSYDFKIFSSIRFLGTRRKQPARFAVYNIPVNIDPTTLNIVSQIRAVADSVEDFFSKISTLFTCRPGSFEEDLNIVEDITSITSGAKDSDVISNITWYQFVNDYFLPRPIIVQKTTLSKEDLELIEKKYDGKLFKSGEELDNEFTDFLGLKSELTRIANSNFEVNNSGKAAFFTDLDKQITTLGALYANVFDKFTLGCLIQEALDCVRPPLACKDILRELSVDVIQQRVALAFPRLPQVVDTVNQIIQKEKDKEAEQLRRQKEAEERGGKAASISTPDGQDAGVLSLTDKVLDAIETVIDIEAICDLRIPFDIPKIELPNFPTIDLMFDINVQLDSAILEALSRFLLDLILGILRDLLECKKLDTFIAGLLNGQIADESGAYGDLARLFTDPQSLSENSNIADAFGNRWNNFVNKASPLMEDIVKFNSIQTAGIGEETLTFRQITDGTAGVGGLKDLLLSGSFQNVAPNVDITRDETGARLDITKLISFTGNGSKEANDFIAEIGAWDLSDDGNSFTLSRLSNDRITVIATIASRKNEVRAELFNPQSIAIVNNVENQPNIDARDNTITQANETTQVVREEKITGQELFDEISKLFDVIVSILSPTETINLLAGKASSETLNTVLEITKIKFPRLMFFIGTQQKIAMIFELFGRSAGLDTLRDKLLLLTASPDANKKLVPVKPCPPFENVFDFRKELLKRTLPEDQVVKIIDELVGTAKERFNNIQDGLVKVKDGVPPLDIFEPLLCGGGKSVDGKRNPVVEDTLNSTIGLMFEPVKMVFDREILKYADAISTVKENNVEIPRKVSNNNNIPIFNPNAKEGNVFGSLQSLLGLDANEEAEDKQGDRINPEFKKMVDSGFVPTKKTGNGKTDFSIDGNPDKDYVDGEEPVFRKENVKKIGSAFKEGIKFNDRDISLDLNKKFKITLKGSLDTQSPTTSFVPFKSSSPEWIIEYIEKNRTLFNVRSEGNIQSSIYGIVPFAEDYRTESRDININENLKNNIKEYSTGEKIPSRQEVFTKIFLNKIVPNITDKSENTKQKLSEMFEEKYESFVKGSIVNIGKGFSRNRLLKKVPNKSLNSLSPEGLSLSNTKAEDLVVLNLINFSPEQNDKQRECGIDPHLLDIEAMKKIVKDRFDKECEESTDEERITGLAPRRNPINSAGFVGVVLTTIRLYCIEYILKSLFVLDEFKFTKDFLEDDLLVDYITSKMQIDIKRLSFYDDFIKEAKIVYDKLIQDKVIKPYDLVDPSCSQNTTDNEFSSGPIDTELKSLIKYQMTSAMKKVAEIIGVDKNKVSDLKSVFFDGLDIIDTFSDFGDPSKESSYTSVNSRFDNKDINKNGRFVLEKYIRVKQPNKLNKVAVEKTLIKTEQNKSIYLNDVISFKNWEEFTKNILSNAEILNLSNKKIFDSNDIDNSLFDDAWKIGLRLVYIPPAFGIKTKRSALANNKNKFKIVEEDGSFQFEKLNTDEVIKNKTLYVFNKEPDPNSDEENFREFNPISLIEKEIEIKDFITLGEVNKVDIFNKIFDKKYFATLKKQILADEKLEILLDYCLFSEKLLSLFVIHSILILSGEQMKFLFEGTKNELKKLFYTLKNLGNYVHKQEFKLKGGNAGEFQRKFNRIGNPAGPSGADALYYWSTTPIHILRALAVMTDPNIFLADKIVAAANSGYLSPKLVRVGSTARIDGTEQIVNVSPGIALDNEFRVLKTGEIVKLKEKTGDIGKPIIEYTQVALIDQIDDGVVSLKIETLPDGTKGPAIRSGPEFSGVPWDKAANQPAPGINLDSFNEIFDKKSSSPIFPGEKINLPYGIASLALTPMQIFGTILGPLCMTMYNPILPLGMEFLKYEPLIYQLPHFQIAAAQTELANELKDDGINLNGANEMKCDEDENQEE